MSSCNESSFTAVCRTFLSDNTALEWTFLEGIWRNLPIVVLCFPFQRFGLKGVQISCESYSNMRHLETPWDIVKTNAENTSVRTPTWVGSAFPTLPVIHFCDSELVTQRRDPQDLFTFLCLPGGKWGIHSVKLQSAFTSFWYSLHDYEALSSPC